MIDDTLKNERRKPFPDKRNNLINNIIDNIIHRNFTRESKSIIESFEDIKDNKILIFNEIKKKKNLLNVFFINN